VGNGVASSTLLNLLKGISTLLEPVAYTRLPGRTGTWQGTNDRHPFGALDRPRAARASRDCAWRPPSAYNVCAPQHISDVMGVRAMGSLVSEI